MPSRLAGRRAAVTGAGGPMGRAVAERLLAEGLEGLALTDISATRLASTAEALSAAHPGIRIEAVRGDVTVAAEAKAFAGTVLDRLGGVDVLVNVVGGIRSRQLYTPFLEMSEAQWKATFDINLLGNFHLVQAFAPGMLERGEGRIINLSSVVFGAEPGQVDYAAAKAAVASMTRSLAAEFAPAVTVNAVAPGLTRTSVTETMPKEEGDRLLAHAFNRRMAEPEEIADAVAFFALRSSRFVTGEILAVSGGMHPHL
jgi:3-oxoacyl-[acyl-carrier protein] reductase